MDKIGKYIIESKIGQGGMGIVYRCRDSESGQSAAVKVLPMQLASNPTFLQRFKREIMTMRRLDHPNIVKIYGQAEVDQSYYYAMEFVEGVSLESILEKKEKMEPLRAINYIRGCAEAIQHSHSQGVIHRDIKPANIMLTTDDNIKLMDFGIAKLIDATRMTATQGVLGTVEYMSPEQSQGRQVDGRTDLYSLGAVLYECLTARLPVTGTNPTGIIMKLRTHQIEAPIEWVPDLPKNLSDLTMRLLEKEPTRRVESARELLRELDRIENQILSSASRPIAAATSGHITTTGTPPRAAWQNPWLLCFAAIVIVGGIWVWRSTLKSKPEDASTQPPVNTSDDPPSGASMQTKALILWARKARERGDYDLAKAFCAILVDHFPDTQQAEAAKEELEMIAQDREKAGESTDETAAEESP